MGVVWGWGWQCSGQAGLGVVRFMGGRVLGWQGLGLVRFGGGRAWGGRIGVAGFGVGGE